MRKKRTEPSPCKGPPLPDDPRIIQLIRAIKGMESDLVRREAEKVGMKVGYRDILFHLSHGLDGCIQYDLVKRIGVRPSTISVALAGMEQEGIIKRTADDNDMRSVRVFLTQKGHQLHRAIHTAIDRTEELCLLGLSEDEVSLLKSMLIKIHENFSREEKRLEDIQIP